MRWQSAVWIGALVACMVVLGGCAGPGKVELESPVPVSHGCQIRAGAALPEGSVATPIGGAQVAAAGAAVTVLGTCPEKLTAFVRSPSDGGWVCYGTPEQCSEALQAQPVTVPAAEFADLQRRAFANEARP